MADETQNTEVESTLAAPPEATEEVKLTPEQQAFDKEVNDLKDYIKMAVDAMVENGYSIGALDYAPDLFKDTLKIKIASSKQYDQFLKDKNVLETAFYSISGKDLVAYEEVAPTTQA